MNLELCRGNYYRVKKDQTILQIALTFSLPPSVLAQENALNGEVREGQILRIPAERGNLYRVKGTESKTLLCGSEEAFAEKNKTSCLYPGQIIFL